MKATVLLIDDDPLDLRALQQLVASWGLDVIAKRSGQDAMATMETVPIDVVVSDVRMPEMGGEDVVRAVTAAFPGIPIILITGHADVRSAVDAMKLGAFDYIVKPPNEDEFRLTIERALEHAELRRENAVMRSRLASGGLFGERMIGRSDQMQQVFELVNRVARTASTVLITGETGTGKELIAQVIHYRSQRAAKPLLAVNCAALNANLIESELFGHEKGAFTGATGARRGRFEDADGGTLFLDEIAETSTDFQAKLLRVLQEGAFQRIGSNRTIRTDTRILASTNRLLADEVSAGRFREDLYYRLNVIPVHIPPLRNRREDIEPLALHFLEMYRTRYRSPARHITADGLRYLMEQDWPGNVRELQHCIERGVVLATGERLAADAFRMPAEPNEARDDSAVDGTELNAVLDECTRRHLLRVLDQTAWQKKKAADLLGIDRATLYRLLKKFSLTHRKA